MSRRTSIVKALTEKLKLIDTASGFNTDLAEAAYAKLVYWDEARNFPSIYAVAGTESREYLPSAFTWGFLGICLKIYCKGDLAQEELEALLEDVENIIDANRTLVYDVEKGYSTTEILITSISTDEGHLTPYAVGEINLQVRYAIM